MFQFLYLFSLIVMTAFCLNCNVGTNDAYSSQICATGQTCIKANLLTGALPQWGVVQVNGGLGTEVYACGDINLYQVVLNNTVVHNAQSCGTDNCFVPNGPSTIGSCDAITDLAGCTARTDCYWCENFLNNSFGLCKELGSAQSPCFAQGNSFFSPPPICQSIGCAPPAEPYSAQQLTLDFLTQFGMPLVSTTPPSVTRNPYQDLAFQLLGAEVRYINESVSSTFCTLDQELIEWCGATNTYFPNIFPYCLVTERWPQPDIFGWIQNTSFTNNRGMNVIFPAICLCNFPGRDANGMPLGQPRAYVIPNTIRVQPYYNSPCGAEKTMLAFYIMLLVAVAIASLFVFYDTILLVYLLFSGKGKKEFGTKTLSVKIILILWFLVAIPGMILFVIPQGSPSQTVASYLLKLLSIIFFIFSFSTAIFTYVEIVLASKVFGNHEKTIIALRISAIVFFVFNFFVLLATIFLLSAFGYFLQKLLSGNVTGYSQIVEFSSKMSDIVKPFMYLLTLDQAFITFCCIILVIYIMTVILEKSAQLKKQKAVQLLFVRAIGLLIAVVVSLPNLGILSTQVYVFGYVFPQLVTSPWPTEYTTQVAFLWLIWGEYLTELCAVLCVAYAMTTVVKKSLIDRLAGRLLGYKVGSSNSSHSTKSTDSRSSQL